MKHKVKAGQTLLDLAIQYAGDATALYEIARANDLSITDEIVAGQVIKIPQVLEVKVASYYQQENLFPAYFEVKKPEGIGYWIIEDDFIVS